MARNVRTSGGMIVGRVVRGPAYFHAERYRGGEFKEIAGFTVFEDAFKAVVNG